MSDQDVRVDERAWALDGTIDVRFGGEIEYAPGLVLVEDSGHRRRIGDVGFDECDTRILERALEVEQAACVRQLVNDDETIARVCEGVADEIRSDKPRAAGDEQCSQTDQRD